MIDEDLCRDLAEIEERIAALCERKLDGVFDMDERAANYAEVRNTAVCRARLLRDLIS